jgi:flagella basal body P-ring formation protein FlgA
LFADAGGEADRVLGPAPPPGTRISVEAPQLAAIAREYGVAWRPQTGFDRAVLVRPGVPLAEAPVMAALRAALVGLGAAPDGAVELQGFQPPMLPVGTAPRIVVEQLSYDANQGGFQGALAVAVPGEPAVTVPVAGRSVHRVILMVAAHRLEPGTALGAGDFTEREVADPAARGAVLRDPGAASGRTVRHAVAAGAAVPLDDLVALPTIARGQRVSMEIAAPGITVTAIGVALSDAGTGETVDVLNPVSRAVVRAEVLGPGRVSVAEGSMPLRQAGATYAGLVR